jgi:hypothetical protein
VTILASIRWAFRFWLALFPAFLVLWYFPYIDFPIRVLTWAVGFLILAGSLIFARRFRWMLLAIYVLVVIFVLWPSHRSIDRQALRSDFCDALKSYRGCRYVWGGEGYFGIDCSGFVRKAMEDAMAERGMASLNPGLLRASVCLYWHDTNAKVIGNGYAGRTTMVTTCPALNGLDYSLLQPGDMAVTVGGDHVMAYLGNKTWIAADPGVGHVATFTIPERTNAYFSTPMRIVRWTILAGD